MADNVIIVKHQQRHDTEANWTSKDPVLLDGEMGFITGTQKYKVGDGTSKWSALAYHTSLTDSEKSKLDGIATGANKTTVDSALSSTSTNPVQNKVINNALSGKANTSHTHDDRYYTETEINSKLSGKSDTNHTHSQYYDSGVTRTANTFLAAPNGKDGTASFRVLSAADIPTITKSKISDFAHSHSDLYYSKTDVDTKLSGKANSSHTHDDRYYTETEVDTKLSGKANSSHNHDDRYYTESEMDGKLSGKANTNHSHNLSTMINGLEEATATPSDADYFVSQYAGGGTTNTSYYRRPVSALWNFIKSKLATVAISGSYNDLSNKPTIPSVGNGTVTIKQNGTSKGSFTMNQSGSTTIELTDNNSWRGIQDNLTSTSTSDSLSANQGKILNESKLMHKTINTSKTDFNTLTETGIYHIVITDALNSPASNHGTLYVDTTVGTKYQVFMSDNVTNYMHKRYYDITNKKWLGWTQLKLTDTVYTHPSYTAKSNGLYKVTVDATGHVSGTTAVTKSDITALGIPSTNTTYPTGTASVSGITKLYTGTGTATDGTMTQSAIKSALDGKSNNGHTHKRVAFVGSDTANTNGWYKVADQTFSGYGDTNVLFAVTSTYGLYYTGILSLQMRSDNTSISCQRLSWLSRCGFPAGDVIINISGMKMTMYVQQRTSQYGRIQFEILSESSINNSSSNLVLYNSNTKESSTPTATKTATDGATVSYANSAGSVAWGNVSGKPSTFTPASHTHNYAGSGSAGGSANSAAKLDTSTAGSATKPVYFSGGKPTACTYTLSKSVPSNAVFTDTNTWRGVQNNLTSTATDQSLSAYQGKLLNEKIKNRILFQSSEPTGQSENDVWIKTSSL